MRWTDSGQMPLQVLPCKRLPCGLLGLCPWLWTNTFRWLRSAPAALLRSDMERCLAADLGVDEEVAVATTMKQIFECLVVSCCLPWLLAAMVWAGPLLGGRPACLIPCVRVCVRVADRIYFSSCVLSAPAGAESGTHPSLPPRPNLGAAQGWHHPPRHQAREHRV